MAGKSEEELRRLWAATLPGSSLEREDPAATYKPAADPTARTLASPLPGPLPAPAPAPADATSRTLPDAGAITHAATLPASAAAPSTMAGARTWAGEPGGGADREAALTLPTIRIGGPETGLATPAAPPGAGVPPSYEILEEIGRGGMGVVYRARQGSLRREVAVKRALGGASSAAREPFVAEALVTGLLDHPNIVPVHELGATPDGEVFLAMKLVSGVSWRDLLHPGSEAEKSRAAAYEATDHLEVLVHVCDAIAFAHERGIVHCDLKPENVMVGGFGEVVVMDWGIAVSIAERPPEAPAHIRHKSEVVRPCGTPAYMPPELAEGRGADIGPWTDVYLLGAVLHEVVTGAPPHRGERLVDVLLRAVESPPPAYGSEVPADLAAIARRAMARETGARYASAAEMRDALKAHLRHRESIAIAGAARGMLEGASAGARLYSDLSEAVAGFRQALVLWGGNEEARRGEREARLALARAALGGDDLGLAEAQAAALGGEDAEGRRIAEAARARRAEIERAARHARLLRRGIVAAVLVALVSLAVGFALVRAERDRAEESALEARRQEAIAKDARAEAEARLARSLLAEGDALETLGRAGLSRERFEAARLTLAALGRPTLPADLGLFAADRRSPRPLATLPPGEGRASGIALAPDRPRLLTVEGGALHIRARSSGALLRVIRLESDEVATGPLAVSADGSRALLALGEGGARGVDLASGALLPRIALAPAAAVHALSLTPDGKQGILARDDGAISVVDVTTGAVLRRLEGHAGPVLDAFISPDGRVVYSAGADGTARQWSLEHGSLIWTFQGHKGAVRALALTFDGRLLTGGDDRTLRLFRVRTGLEEARLDGPSGPVSAIALTPDARRAVVASQERTLRVYDLEAGALVRSIDDALGPAARLAISEDGALLAALSGDHPGNVRLFDLPRALAPGEPGLEMRLLGKPPARGPVLLLEGGRVALSAGERGAIHARDVETGLLLREFAPSGATPVALCRLPAPAKALAAWPDGSLAVLDLETGKVERPFPPLGRPGLAGLSLAADGRRGVAAHAGGSWDRVDLLAPGGEGTIPLPGREPVALALSADGNRVLGGASAEGYGVFEERPMAPVTGGAADHAAPRRTPLGRHDAPVRAVAYLHGEPAFAASGGDDGEVRIWDLARGEEVRALPAPGPVVSLSAEAGPEGTRLLAGIAGGGLALLDLGRPALERALLAATPSALARGRLLAHRGAYDLAAEALAGPDALPLEPDPLPPLERARLSIARGDLLGADRALGPALESGEAPRWLVEALAARVRADLERGGSLLGRCPDIFRDLAVLPGGGRVLALGRDGCLRSIALETALESWSALVGREPSVLAVSPDGALAAVGGRDDAVALVEVASGRARGSIALSLGSPRALAFARGGAALAVVASDAYGSGVRILDVAARREVAAVTLAARATALAADPSGTLVLAGDREGRLHLLDAARPEAPARSFPAIEGGSVDRIVLLPGAKRALVAGGWKLRLLDLESGAAIRDLGDGRIPLQGIAVSPDGRLAAAGSSEGHAVIFDVETGAAVARTGGHRSTVLAVAFAPDGRLLVTAGQDGTVRGHPVHERR
jgi:hypothetical protein